MNVLWSCNIMLPRISDHLNIKSRPIGGWLAGLSDQMIDKTDISLCVLFPHKEKPIAGEAGRLKYIGFSPPQNNIKTFKEYIKKYRPDVIHIFGTEYLHSYTMIRACEELCVLDRTIVSIQGLKSIYSKHYYCNLPVNIIHSNTFHDIVRKSNIYHGKKDFEKSGIYEIQTPKIARNVSGRTEWDYAIAKQMNPSINYYRCNEILRQSFYDVKWNLDKVERHSIFVSQSNYPIKGFHLMIEALNLIINKYPDIKLYTTGRSPFGLSMNEKLRQNSYHAYLERMIKKHDLMGRVVFLGELNEIEMRNRFLRSHVFVCCSSIENSPNSVGEAMLLGVPVVSSDVGGVKDMLKDKVEGFLYPFDETYMLAHYIDKVFSDDRLAEQISVNSQKHAEITHSREKILSRTIEIYETIRGK